MTKNRKTLTYCQRLIERLRAAQDGATDYRLAQLLEITPQAIYQVKNKGTMFSDLTLNKIAQLLGENPMKLIGQSHLETQDFPGMNNVWEAMVEWGMKEELKQFQELTQDGIGKVSGL